MLHILIMVTAPVITIADTSRIKNMKNSHLFRYSDRCLLIRRLGG